MAIKTSTKRKHEETQLRRPQRPSKKFKKQRHYDSSSSSSADEATQTPAIDLASSDSDPDDAVDDEIVEDPTSGKDIAEENPASPASDSSSPSPSSASDSEASLPTSTTTTNPTKSKRNDPTAFATSIASILASKLPQKSRSDPVLARSSSALEANTAIREAQLERKAKAQIRSEKKLALEKGRVKDVLLGVAVGEEEEGGGKEGVGDAVGGEQEEGRVGRMLEEEKKLKKMAQRGVVKLFNAVRMAHVRGEEARKEAVKKGVVGEGRKKERVGEMSKKGFLELVASGGGNGKGTKSKKEKMVGGGIEEA